MFACIFINYLLLDWRMSLCISGYRVTPYIKDIGFVDSGYRTANTLELIIIKDNLSLISTFVVLSLYICYDGVKCMNFMYVACFTCILNEVLKFNSKKCKIYHFLIFWAYQKFKIVVVTEVHDCTHILMCGWIGKSRLIYIKFSVLNLRLKA